jgi:hypothetical protein
MQVKKKLCEKEPTMKPQRPEDDAVVELAFKPIDWIAKVDVAAVDVVGNVTFKEGWQIMLQSRDRSLNPLQVVTLIWIKVHHDRSAQLLQSTAF